MRRPEPKKLFVPLTKLARLGAACTAFNKTFYTDAKTLALELREHIFNDIG